MTKNTDRNLVQTDNKEINLKNVHDHSVHSPPDKHVNAHNRHSPFDEDHILHELKHYLPSQTPLRDFIHHNALHAFQASKFYDAIFRASKIFGYQVTLQLNEFRKLYEIGRIRKDVLERVVISKKGNADAQTWINKLLSSNYDTSNIPRIGSLRAQWKTAVKLDLDTLVQPLLFRILCSYLDQGIAIWKFPSDQHGFLSSVINLEKHSFTSFFKTKSARNLLLNGNYDIKDLLKRITGDESLFFAVSV